MTLPDGYIDLPGGKLASVVTYLEMLAPPPPRDPVPAPDGLAIRRAAKPDPDWYRRLFRAIGEEWLWFSRLHLSDEEFVAQTHSGDVDVFVLERGAEAKGLIEFDHRRRPDIELALFGVTGDLTGAGVGRHMIDWAIREAWRHSPARFHLHTCTLDHPKALSFYVKAGFRPYKRGIEISTDPRVTGALPRTSASWIPLIE